MSALGKCFLEHFRHLDDILIYFAFRKELFNKHMIYGIKLVSPSFVGSRYWFCPIYYQANMFHWKVTTKNPGIIHMNRMSTYSFQHIVLGLQPYQGHLFTEVLPVLSIVLFLSWVPWARVYLALLSSWLSAIFTQNASLLS